MTHNEDGCIVCRKCGRSLDIEDDVLPTFNDRDCVLRQANMEADQTCRHIARAHKNQYPFVNVQHF